MAYVRVTFLLRRLFTLEKFPARVCQQLTGRIRTDERGTRVGNKTLNVNDAIQGSRAAVLLKQPTIHNNCLRPTVTVITTPTHFRPGDTTEKTERRGISVQKILPFIVDIGSRRNIARPVCLTGRSVSCFYAHKSWRNFAGYFQLRIAAVDWRSSLCCCSLAYASTRDTTMYMQFLYQPPNGATTLYRINSICKHYILT